MINRQLPSANSARAIIGLTAESAIKSDSISQSSIFQHPEILMAGRKRNAPAPDTSRRSTRANASSQSSPVASSSSRRTRSTAASQNATPDIYREMILETKRKNAAVGSQISGTSEPPLKRRRPGERPPPKVEPKKAQESESQTLVESTSSKVIIHDQNKSKRPNAVDDDDDDDDEDEEEDIEFEDVVLPPPTIQTMIEESDDDDDDPILFEDVNIDPGVSSAIQPDDQPMELNLTAQKALMDNTRRQVDRRKVITTEEKRRRVEIHKTHLLCLLSHVERRNRWCNDPEVHGVLRPLLTGKMMSGLHPRTNQPQFGRSEALKTGILEARNMFKLRYTITERGLRRSLWAEDEDLLKKYQLPDDIESTLEKGDFLQAAKSLTGSRDVGAQLFCALLRSAGVDARLVCSLQPLSCVPGAPTMPKPRNTSTTNTPSKPSKADIYAAALAKYETKHDEFTASSTTPSPYRRLGHPNATAYNLASLTPTLPPPSRPEIPTPKKIRGESPFPIYWIEVLDEAYQKWHPVDPLVTCTQWRPRALEPPSSDRENCMTYVVAFEVDGSAKDVTRRYVKAYNSKTRRMRIDGIIAGRLNSSIPGALGGERWWRRALRKYSNPWRDVTDLEQIERNELAAEEAKEPMPRNVADFKDHPVYALERHLRRHEVLVPGAQSTGTVGAGSKAPLERIYRRRDVRVARSRDKWYRMGRVVRGGEEPVKVLPKRVTKRSKMWGDDDDYNGVAAEEEDEDDPDRVGLFGDAVLRGTPIYTAEQTDLYVPPPVRNGRVPKNKFGNIDVYVPSMVPEGGVHVDHERAAQAAFILGVDYAPALTGFRFRGKHGTAVLSGVVVPKEAERAVWVVIEGLLDLDEEMESERRRKRVLGVWKRWLRVLRIRERIWANVDPEEGADGGCVVDEEEDGSEDGGGGFVVDEEEDEDGGGGFVVDDEDVSQEERPGQNKGKGKGKGRATVYDSDEEMDVGMGDVQSDVSEEYFMGDDDEGGGFLVE